MLLAEPPRDTGWPLATMSFSGGFGEVDGPRPFHGKVADTGCEPQFDLSVGKRRGVDAKRRADVVEHDPTLDLADTASVIMVVADLILRHPGRHSEDRFAAVHH